MILTSCDYSRINTPWLATWVVYLDSFSKDLGDLETLFKDNTLEPAMDLYQKIKQILHLHVAQSEKQLVELKAASGMQDAQDLLELIDGNRKNSA